MKGIGELGVCGTGAAVGNAVFNATGIRVRSFPITMAKLLPGLPALRIPATITATNFGSGV
jgi:xanthine dehydrogenase YagR molybdenum-binding subunit